MVKKLAKELKQEIDIEKQKLEKQKQAREDLVNAVLKSREKKQERSINTKRKILIGAFFLKKYDNNVNKFLDEHPDFYNYVGYRYKNLFELDD